LCAIVSNVEFSQLIIFKEHTNAHDAWNALEKHYLRFGLARELTFRTSLHNLQMDEEKTVHIFFNKFKGIVNNLRAVGGKVSQAEAAMQLLTALPRYYTPFRMAL